MERESLDPGARHTALVITSDADLSWQWRREARGGTSAPVILGIGQVRKPILLRLTRRGSAIEAEYSQDDGRTFQAAGAPYRFEPPLPETVYTGLAIASENEADVSEVKFSGLHIRKR